MEELKAEVGKVNITIYTKDSLEYKFLKENYSIQGDTLRGFGTQTIGSDDRPFHGSISFADITLMETQKFNLAETIIVIVIVIGVPVGLVIWASISWKGP
jgi:hypothetical protein